MRIKSWITLLLITQSIFAASQVEIENLSLKEPTYKALVRLKANKIILVNTHKKRTYNVVSNDSLCQITKISNTEYLIFPSNERKMDTLTIIENGVAIRTDYFQLFSPPLPTVQLGKIHFSENFTTIQRIESEPNLRIVYGELYKRADTIVGFDLKIYDLNDSLLYTSEKNRGASLTPEHLLWINSMNPGYRIEFCNIYYTDEAGIRSVLSPFKLEIE